MLYHHCINRIRLEFKEAHMKNTPEDWRKVLIESDWNLKYFTPSFLSHHFIVLIESDWNLKEIELVEVEDLTEY